MSENIISRLKEWLQSKSRWRLDDYPSDVATLNCRMCGRQERVRIDELQRLHGANATLDDVKHKLAEECKARNRRAECHISFYEIDIPSLYQ